MTTWPPFHSQDRASLATYNCMTGRIVKACTECKQVKLRCDAKETFPNPCSRCQTRRLHCTIDSGFRRVPSRQRVRELSEELHKVKQSIKSKQNPQSTSFIVQDLVHQDAPDESTISLDPDAMFALDDPDTIMEPARLGSFLLDEAQILNAFRLFAAHFYFHLPVIDTKVTISSIYQRHPFLFWTIVVVTTRIDSLPGDQVANLTEEYTKLVRSEIFKVPLPLPSIQALLYLCTWPLPVRKQPDDPSWMYCGIILNSCLYMGLHQPASEQPLHSIGVMPGDRRYRIQTWLGYFLTSTIFSSLLGVPPSIRTASDLSSLEALLRSQGISREFAAQVEIQRHMAKYIDFLSNHDSCASSSALIQLFEPELNGVKSRFSDTWTFRLDFNLALAKLQLYTMSIIREIHKRSSGGNLLRKSEHDASLELLLHMGLSIAASIVNLFNSEMVYFKERENPSNKALQLSLPKYYFRGLAFATLFLTRYTAYHKSARPEDQHLARNQVAVAYSKFKKHSTKPNDECDRVAGVLHVLSQQLPHDMHVDSLKVHRMSATVIHDALNTAAELRSRPVHISDSEAHHDQHIDIPIEGMPIEQVPTSGAQETLLGDTSSLTNEWIWDNELANDIWNDCVWGMFGRN